MESGGKAVTKGYRKKITVVLSLVLPVILLFAILNCFTTYVFYEDYKYKMNLMTEIAAKEEFSGLDAVSELLKDKDIETNEQGRRLLEQYGYWGNKGNAFYSQFQHQVMVIGAVSTVICVCLLYTSDAADDMQCVDLGGRRIIKKIFFSSRRRHTRCSSISWARRCV